jgi:hypothetical protein
LQGAVVITALHRVACFLHLCVWRHTVKKDGRQARRKSEGPGARRTAVRAQANRSGRRCPASAGAGASALNAASARGWGGSTERAHGPISGAGTLEVAWLWRFGAGSPGSADGLLRRLGRQACRAVHAMCTCLVGGIGHGMGKQGDGFKRAHSFQAAGGHRKRARSGGRLAAVRSACAPGRVASTAFLSQAPRFGVRVS